MRRISKAFSILPTGLDTSYQANRLHQSCALSKGCNAADASANVLIATDSIYLIKIYVFINSGSFSHGC
jgi:hypothetical protein